MLNYYNKLDCSFYGVSFVKICEVNGGNAL